MVTQTLDVHHFNEKARQIRAHIPTVLEQWGLLPKFMSWRLTQDPGTGLVVLFGVLNDKYIATHTQTPFGAYFDPRLLHDLTTDLQVQVVPSNSDGLRYAFILDWGQLGEAPGPVGRVPRPGAWQTAGAERHPQAGGEITRRIESNTSVGSA